MKRKAKKTSLFFKAGLIIFLCLFPAMLIHGQIQIQGEVISADGESLPGTNVVIEGANQGTVTDTEGKYSVIVPDENAVLVFSFLGYITERITVGNNTLINVQLIPDIESLDEVVVVGYGTQMKSDLVSSVAVIEVDDAQKTPTTNVAEMLRGKSAGIQVTLSDARPGGNSQILIRGKHSILAENDPLFIVDGIPYDNINAINSEDVKSIEVLKDAAAQAIYGARAANGVILVTTKRGVSEKLNVSYHGYYGQQWVTRNFELYDGEEWAQYRREAYRTDDPNNEYVADDYIFTDTQLEVLENKEFVDWEDLVINNASQQNHTLSLSGGGEKTKLYSSFNFIDQKGMIAGSGYKRGTARLNIDQKVNNRLNFGANIYLLTDEQDRETGSYTSYITIPPLAKVYDENGELLRYPEGTNSTRTSPLWDIRESENIRNTNEYSFSLFGEYEILPGLKYKINTFYNQRNHRRNEYYSTVHSQAYGVDGRVNLYYSNKSEYLVENILTYNKDIGSESHMDFTFLQSTNSRSFTGDLIEATGFTNDLLGYDAIGSATEFYPVKREGWDRQLLSYMGRARLNLANKYLLTLTGRIDGSSVFGTDKEWGYFPSAALGWKVHKESFMNSLNFVNELKLRVSYGSIGNEAISPYQTLGTSEESNYVFGSETVAGYLPGNSLHNPGLIWETSTTLNAGIDYGIANNLFVGYLEFYNTKTTNLLIKRTLSGTTGYTDIIDNIGKIQNQGIELNLTANVVRHNNFDASLTLNFSRNRNEILDLYGEVDNLGQPINDLAGKHFIGEPIDVIYSYKFDGIWQEDDDIANSHSPLASPGQIRVANINNDTLIDENDKVVIRKDPKWVGSVAGRIRVYQFELYAELYIVQGAKKLNPFLYDFNSGGSMQGVLNGIKVDYYTPEKPSSEYPRPVNSAPDQYLTAYAVRDASYVRIRTISLSYQFPKNFSEKLKVTDFRIYGTLSNPFTWTKYLSYSPENNAGQYPDSKSFIVGVKLTL